MLFAFDAGNLEEGGRYAASQSVELGENNPAIQMVPNLPVSEAQSKALATAKGPWTLYTTMPIDAVLFSGMDDATRQAPGARN